MKAVDLTVAIVCPVCASEIVRSIKARAPLSAPLSTIAADKLTFGWYGRRDFKGLFAMQNLVPVEAELWGLHPESRRCQDRCDGRKGKEVLLVDEAQLSFVHWIGAQAKPERIEDRVFPRKLFPNFGRPPVQELVIVERHGDAFSLGDPRHENGLDSGGRSFALPSLQLSWARSRSPNRLAAR